MTNHIEVIHLENGLQIWLKEIHTAPIITHWIWYRVGSRNETSGLTGISHWVEHMQFKGTPRFPGNVLDKMIAREGGVWNAFTYMDWTAYFQTMPANAIDIALQLEADRMVNSIYDSQEVESERTVVISELEGGENDPLFRLGREVQKAAFTTHPYRNEVIGELNDLKHIQRDDLYRYYRSMYCPNNALVAVAGDFEIPRMRDRLMELFSPISPGNPPRPAIRLEEKFLGGERRVEIAGPGETTYIEIVYRVPPASQKDFFYLSVLDSLLSGPSSLNMFGGAGISNKTCRLYRALVETELAVGVSGGLQATIDPFLYEITMILRPEQSDEALLRAFDNQIAKIQEEGISQGEIHRAVKQARALFSYSGESISNQGFWLGYANMFDDYDWFVQYVNRLDEVSCEDVQRVAQEYLSKSNRVVGIYRPNKNAESV